MSLQTADNTSLTKGGRVLLWAQVLERLREGEVFLTNQHFRNAMQEEYIMLQGAAPSAGVCDCISHMVAAVNDVCPQTYLAQGLENGVKKALENGVHQLKWDINRIQEKGAAAVYRFSKHTFIRGLLKLRHLSFDRLNAVKCVRCVIDQAEQHQPIWPSGEHEKAVPLEMDGSLSGYEEPALVGDADIQLAIEQGEITRREVMEQLRRHERRRSVLEAQQIAQLPQYLETYVDREAFSPQEAKQAALICQVKEQVRKGEIRQEKGEALLDVEISPPARRVLMEKIFKAVAVPVLYLRLFESLKRIRLEFDEGLCVLVRHKHLVLDDDPDQNMTPLVNDLLKDSRLLDLVWDIATGKDREIRIITIPLPPYKAVTKYNLGNISNLTIEESFVNDLRQLDLIDMSERLNSPERSVRVRAAADIHCFIYLLNKVVKPGRFRHKLCMIKVSHTLEEIRAQVVGIYHSSPYLEAGRQRAKMHVRRSLSRVMRHIPPARQYAADQRCEAFILDVESKLRSSAVDFDPMDMAVGLTGGGGYR